MSQIRSTIDIMMERTSGMGLSSSEKDQIRKESLEKKAKGYALKLHDYPDSTKKLVEDLMSEPSGDLEELRKLVWNNLVLKIDNNPNLTTFLDLIEKLPFAPSRKDVLDKFRASLKGAQKDKSKDRKSLLERERKKLADSGISGAAVVPVISRDSENKRINELINSLKANLIV